MTIANDDETHGGWVGREAELDELAAAMLGKTPADARAMADEHGVQLRVCDQYGVGCTKAYRFGRITVDAHDGVVTRAERG